MRPQSRKYSCGPAALRAALHMLGRRVTERALIKHARTTPHSGTDEAGIVRAIEHYGLVPTPRLVRGAGQAWRWVRRQLGQGRPVLLCTDKWSHWVCVVGSFGSCVLVFDPEVKRRYSGLRPYTYDELAKRWGVEGSYYGVSVRSH